MEVREAIEVLKNIGDVISGRLIFTSEDIKIKQGERGEIIFHDGKMEIVIGRNLDDIQKLVEIAENKMPYLLTAVMSKYDVFSFEVETTNYFGVKFKGKNIDGEAYYSHPHLWPDLRMEGNIYDIIDAIASLEVFLMPFDFPYNTDRAMFIVAKKSLIGLKKIMEIGDDEVVEFSFERTHDKDIEVAVKRGNVSVRLWYSDGIWRAITELSPIDIVVIGSCGECYHWHEYDKECIKKARSEVISSIKKAMKVPNDYEVSVGFGTPSISYDEENFHIYVSDYIVEATLKPDVDVAKAISRLKEAKNIAKRLGIREELGEIIRIIREHNKEISEGKVWFADEIRYDKLILSKDRVAGIYKGRDGSVAVHFDVSKKQEELKLLVELHKLFREELNYIELNYGKVIISTNDAKVTITSNDEKTLVVEVCVPVTDKSIGAFDRIVKKLKDAGFEVVVKGEELLSSIQYDVRTKRGMTAKLVGFERFAGTKVVFEFPNGKRVAFKHPDNAITRVKLVLNDFLWCDEVEIDYGWRIIYCKRGDSVTKKDFELLECIDVS